MPFSESSQGNHPHQHEAGTWNSRQRSQTSLLSNSQLDPVDDCPPNAAYLFEDRGAGRENEMITQGTGAQSIHEFGFLEPDLLDGIQGQNYVRQAERPFALPGLASPEGPITDRLTSVQNPPPSSWHQVLYDGNYAFHPDMYYYEAIATCALTGCQWCQQWWPVPHAGDGEGLPDGVRRIGGIANGGAYFQTVPDGHDRQSQQGDSLAVMASSPTRSTQSNAGLEPSFRTYSDTPRRPGPENIERPSGSLSLVWNPTTDEQVPYVPGRNHRTQAERDQTRSIRLSGGACDKCRRYHRRCRPDHPPSATTSRRARREVQARWQEDTAAMGAQFSDSI